MKGKWIWAAALILLASVVVLSGCVERTPRGEISAPVTTTPAGIITLPITTPTPTTPASIGETVKFAPSSIEGSQLQVTLVRVIWDDCGFSSTYEPCVCALLKVKNTGTQKENDFIFSPALLDDLGKQHAETRTLHEDEYAGGDIYPAVTKEGYVCFEKPETSSKTLKIVLPFGVIGATNIVYQLSANELITPAKSADLTLRDVEYSWSTFTSVEGGYGSISNIKYTIKNTGEIRITPQFDVTITKGGKDIVKKENVGFLWTPLGVGESKSDKIGIFQSISESGQYTVKVTVRDKDLATPITTATKSFTIA